jgi:hypothetical protein
MAQLFAHLRCGELSLLKRSMPEGSRSMPLPLLILHILAGTPGLLSGTFAIAARKGTLI